jgi:hypothetical protein
LLRKSGYESLTACTPDDVSRFLAWKDYYSWHSMSLTKRKSERKQPPF